MNVETSSPNFQEFLDLFISNYYNYLKQRININTDIKDVFTKIVQKNQGILNNIETIFINYLVDRKIQMSYEYFRLLQENKDQLHVYVFYLLCVK